MQQQCDYLQDQLTQATAKSKVRMHCRQASVGATMLAPLYLSCYVPARTIQCCLHLLTNASTAD
jgi:hypothetical protein